MGNKVSFCFVCGAPTRRGYPGGDVENGPVEWRCSADKKHQSFNEAVYIAVTDASDRTVKEYLESVSGALRHTVEQDGPEYVAVPPEVRKAAKILLDDCKEQDSLSNKYVQ